MSGPRSEAIKNFSDWYDQLPVQGATRLPARGSLAATLVVLERLKVGYDLNLDCHRAPGGSQVRGVSGAAVKRILAAFGETRRFLSEGGRTNRGALAAIGAMLQALANVGLESISPKERIDALSELQRMLVEKVRLYHSQQRLRVDYSPALTTRHFLEALLSTARENGKEGPVAQYLVGAKLQIRFPQSDIRNVSYSTADTQLGEFGDFRVGDTAFHVTVAPMPPIFDKCKTNVDQGLQAYLLVPERTLLGARQNAESIVSGRVCVESVESFVAQNVDELGFFSMTGSREETRNLIVTYNNRVDSVEADKSMLIDIPQGLS